MISQNQVKRFVALWNLFAIKAQAPKISYGCFSIKYLHRKAVIHPHVLVGIPCYDFTPVTCPTLGGPILKMVKLPTSGITDSHGVTGGVYNTRERIHPDILIRDY